MKEEGIHEGCIEQIQRLYQDRLFSGSDVATDEKANSIDDLEMRPDVQEKVAKLWNEAVTIYEISDLEGYRKDFTICLVCSRRRGLQSRYR
jgi:enoyl-[acyl-carrier protein] reductase/trans-2-enoyl-CoA reductase (NAD+)